jgi:hypothetical protein
MKGFADIAHLEEDERISIIGKAAMVDRQTVGFIVDRIPGKAARYIRKLKERFPGIVILAKFNGPTKHAVSVKVGPPPASNN